MIKKKLLFVALSALFCASAKAGYAQLAPPSGWSPGQYAASANDASFGRVIHTPNGPTANVGGQTVKLPAAYRFAANAPRFAAAAIFANPYVRSGVAIASWLGLAGLVWDSVNRVWTKPATGADAGVKSDGFRYTTSNAPYVDISITYDSASQICALSLAQFNIQNGPEFVGTTSACSHTAGFKISVKYNGNPAGSYLYDIQRAGPSNCPAGWYVTPAGCVQNPPVKTVTKEEFEELLPTKPMPQRVPQELPQPTPLPIERPSPYINPEPGANPEHRPRFVPTGDPVPNPKYDPNAPPSPDNQPWFQPGIRIVPSPTETEPWRVDYQPVARPQPTKDPVPEPENAPGTDPADKPKPEEDQSLCEKHPDVVACEKGEVNDTPLPEIPVLYERKYPDGLVGIWNQKSEEIKQSSAFSLAAQLMPTSLTSGTCPTWPITLEFASWASYGERDVAPPCWIWDVAKTIVIISALMLARSLIFGG